MNRSEDYRRKAYDLLSRATAEVDMKRRSDLIDEAAHWRRLAEEAANGPTPDNDDEPHD